MGTDPTPKSSWALAMSSHRLLVSVRRLVSSRLHDCVLFEVLCRLHMSWRSGINTHTHTQGRKQGKWCQKTQTSYLFNFLEILWPSADTLYDFNWGQSEKEEEHCYCKSNAPEVIVIFLAFRACTEIMNFLLIYAKVQLERTSEALEHMIKNTEDQTAETCLTPTESYGAFVRGCRNS